MKKLTMLASGLLLWGSAAAQDGDDFQSGNSFEDIPAVEQEAAEDLQDGNSFTDDTSDANSFASDSADEPDANSFATDSVDESDANSFAADSTDESDANSFASESGDTSDGNSFTSDANSFDSNSFSDESYSDDGAWQSDADEEDRPWELYAGADYVWTNASFSKPGLIERFGGDDFDSSMVRLRVGMRLFDAIGLEAQIGTGDTSSGDLKADEASTDMFYGIYLVPTGVILDTVEVSATIGYARTSLERGSASEDLGGASFGVNLELPLYTGESLELRLGGGGAVFRAQNSARIYGYHAGLRIDFKI